jgi:AraC-like DNA-binding protein
MVLAFMSDGLEQRYLTHALQDLVTIQYVAETAQVVTGLGGGRAAALVIHLDRRPAEMLAAVASRARRAHPFLPIIGYADSRRVASRQIQRVMSAGATHLVLRGVDNPRQVISDAMADSGWQQAADAVERCAADLLPQRVREIIAYCLTHLEGNLSVGTIASGLRVSRRTLVRRLAGVASPQATITWTRLLMAVSLMRRPDWSVQRTALALNFGSASALRTMLRRHAALTVGQLREHQGLEAVARALMTPATGEERVG